MTPTEITYKFSVNEVKKMFASALSVPVEKVSVRYNINTIDQRETISDVTSVTVTVKQ